MYSTIILSHGDLTNGLKDTMIMITGSQDDVHFISFTPSDSVEDFEKKVKVIYRCIPKEHHILFLIDLYGGTPSHVANAFHLKDVQRVEVISGVNLAMLLTAVLSQHKDLSEVVDNIVHEARSGIQRLAAQMDLNEEDE